MDKTTKDLRARLRDCLAIHLEDWERAEGFGSSNEVAELDEDYRRIVEDGLAASDDSRTEELIDRLATWLERPKDEFLRHLATAEEVSLLAASLKLSTPLKLVPADPPWTREEWVVTWPNGTKLAHDLRTIDVLFQLAEPLLRAWIDHLDEGAPDIDGLTPNARAFLKAMLALKLHDDTRAGQDEIWAKVAELGDPVEGKPDRLAAVGILKDRKLIESKPGTGTILTTAGLSLARSLSPPE
jgi:hypothetical protein